jgi:hypothetical protein
MDSKTNPYAAQLGDADPLRVAESTPKILEELSQSLRENGMNRSPLSTA